MARTIGSYFQTIVPYFYQNNIAAINWGFVDGKTQTKFPWGSPEGAADPVEWFHDILTGIVNSTSESIAGKCCYADGTSFNITETNMIKAFASIPKNAIINEVLPVKQSWQYTIAQPAQLDEC